MLMAMQRTIQLRAQQCQMKLLLYALCFAVINSALSSSAHTLPGQKISRKSDLITLYEVAGEARTSLLLSQTLLIVVPVQWGTGYSWKIVRDGAPLGTLEKLESPEIQRLTEQKILQVPAEKNWPGGAANQVFRLRPTKVGESRIELQLTRHSEPNKPDKKLIVTVNVLDPGNN
jgi:predicted secreted protein